MNKLLILGGGAAGLTAGIFAAEAGLRVKLWERGEKPGRKLMLTGGGRCNLTHVGEPSEIIKGIPGNGRFLYSALSKFPPDAVMRFFEALGVRLEVQSDGKVFPCSGSAEEVRTALLARLCGLGVEIAYGRRAQALLFENGKVVGAVDDLGREERCDALLIACGGSSYPATGSTGDGYTLAAQAGHTIIKPAAALAALICKERWPGSLAGLSLPEVTLTAFLQTDIGEQKLGERHGALLFTHNGLSGPAALDLSRVVNRAFSDNTQARVYLELGLLSELSEAALEEEIDRLLAAHPRGETKNALKGLLPAALLEALLANAGAASDASSVTRAERRQLAWEIKHGKLVVAHPSPIASAMVPSGGVSCREIDPKTMGSKLCDGLFFAGEVLDVDGYSGGYNLQIAFSTAYSAAAAASVIE